MSSQLWDRACLSFLLLLCAAVAALAVAGPEPLGRVGTWFDDLFFQYNLALLLLTQVSVPLITFLYVRRTKGEKQRRLAREVPAEVWEREKDDVQRSLDAHFKFRNYVGSVLLVLVMITLGMSIILLLKPVSADTAAATGVNYRRGANFLLAGPVIELPPASPVFYHRVILSLTAFQFGFLGGYVYFIGHLVRSYFTLDLTPHTYVESAIRMATASVLALVLSFVLPAGVGCAPEDPAACMQVPLVSFFLGYFPNRALLLIEKTATKLVRLGRVAYNATPLSSLAGMSFAHEVRLGREGFDSAENLSHADPLDLAVRTGFGYRQLRQWIGEAWLHRHLGDDYESFVRRTGLGSRDNVAAFLASWKSAEPDWSETKRVDDAVQHLTTGAPDLLVKVHAVCALARHAPSAPSP